jgi:NAD(P)-dependent dehydrogenase (short-subunit alcohol dehydrogenase family)
MGLELAYYLAVRGASLSLADIQEAPLQVGKQSILKAAPEARVIVRVVEVREPKQVSEWIAATVKEFGSLSGAANLAGIAGKSVGTATGTVRELDYGEWKYVLDVNLNGVFNCLKSELRAIEQGGSIVNAASVVGLTGSPQNAHYSASKHAVIGLTQSAAKEEAETEIRVNCVCPSVSLLFVNFAYTDCFKVDLFRL